MNAIILAAGLGSRFGEITKHTHKALLPIQGIPNIERTIQYLKEKNINEIIIITGYLNNQFSYLKEKYNCIIINNEKYNIYNNIYSIYKAFDYFGKNTGSYIIDGDVVLFSNIFSYELNSRYYLIQRPLSENNEWIPIININDKIIDITVSSIYKPSLLGISYWNKEDIFTIKKEFNTFLNEKHLSDSSLYWDDVPKKIMIKLKPSYKLVNCNQAIEMDTVNDYEKAKGFI